MLIAPPTISTTVGPQTAIRCRSLALGRRAGGASPLDLRLLEREPDRAVEALLAHDVDVAVVHAYSLLPRELPECDHTALLDDPVLLAVHPDRAADLGLRPGSAARLADLADAPWLVPGAETSCHEMIRRACGAAGFVPRAVAEATDFSVLAAMVSAGAGVALMPRMTLPDGIRGLSLHPLVQPVTRTVSVLARRARGCAPPSGGRSRTCTPSPRPTGPRSPTPPSGPYRPGAAAPGQRGRKSHPTVRAVRQTLPVRRPSSMSMMPHTPPALG